jgi:hypothetical protein
MRPDKSDPEALVAALAELAEAPRTPGTQVEAGSGSGYEKRRPGIGKKPFNDETAARLGDDDEG